MKFSILTVGILDPFIVNDRVLFVSLLFESVVNKVAVDYEEFSCSSLISVHVNKSFKYG